MSLSKHVELTRRISDGPINNDNAGAYVRTGPDADGRAIAPAVKLLSSFPTPRSFLSFSLPARHRRPATDAKRPPLTDARIVFSERRDLSSRRVYEL